MTEILRIDKFHVPEASLPEFLATVGQTHEGWGAWTASSPTTSSDCRRARVTSTW